MPFYQAPGRTQLKLLVTSHAQLVKEQIIQQLPSDRKISLALDCWTSPNHLAFLAILGYFITDGGEYKEILGFHPLYEKHSGKSLAQLVAKTLQEYRIKD